MRYASFVLSALLILTACGHSFAPSAQGSARNAVAPFTANAAASNFSSLWTIYGMPQAVGFLASDNAGDIFATSYGGSNIMELNAQRSSTFVSSFYGLGLAFGADGNMWSANGTSLEKFVPSSGMVYGYSLYGHANYVENITRGPDAMWFTDSEQGGSIGRISYAGTIKLFYRPASAPAPYGIVKGPDGNYWFTTTGTIGVITPTGTITEYPLPNGAAATGITLGPDSNLWFIDSGGDVGKVTTSGTITEYQLPSGITVSGQHQIASALGYVWVVGQMAHGYTGLARVATNGAITVFQAPFDAQCCGVGITRGTDGNPWFGTANQIGTRRRP